MTGFLRFFITRQVLGPTQVKCRLLISSIFDAMNFQHFLEMLEIILQNFKKYWKFIESKNARN